MSIQAIRFRPAVLLAVLAVVLAGCSAHYRNALQEYRKAEPFPFQQRTMQWVEKSEHKSASSLESPEQFLKSEYVTGSTQDVYLRLAAEFFDVSTPTLAGRFNTLRTSSQLDSALTQQLDWDTLKVAVALHNPSILAARDRWQATLRQYSQADFLDSLIGQYRTFTRYLNVQTGKPLNKEMVQRFFPYPSTISLKGEVIRQQARMAELDWQKTLRESVVDAGDAFFDYQYLHRAENTTSENVTLLQNMLDVVKERYRVGRGTQADLLKVQTALERQKNMLADLQTKQKSAAARINALLNRPPDALLGTPDDANLADPNPHLSGLTATALKTRQELNMQRAKVARSDAAIRMGEVMNRPLFTQGYSILESGMMPDASVGKSTMPYGAMAKTKERPQFAQTEAYLSEMRHRLQGARQALTQAEANTRSMARKLFDDLDVARRDVELVEQIVLPQDESTYQTTLGAYTSGRSSFIDLLDAERALLAARLEQHDDHRTLNQAILHLANVRGTL